MDRYIFTKEGGFFMEKNSDKIVFEEYGIEFTDDDFKGVDQETLIKCKRKLLELLKKIENNE